jgi:ribosomal protein S18 acetylase RimI-like enzyme
MLLVHRDAVFSKAAAQYAPATLSAWAAGPTPDRVARIELRIADPGSVVLVAEVGDEIIGYVVATPARNELRAVYVKPNSIGHVGYALLAEIERRAFNAGTEYLTCSASLSAVEFYKANGYTEEGRGEHRLRTGDLMDCVFMRKKLEPPAPGQ